MCAIRFSLKIHGETDKDRVRLVILNWTKMNDRHDRQPAAREDELKPHNHQLSLTLEHRHLPRSLASYPTLHLLLLVSIPAMRTRKASNAASSGV
jgi:hypothetical protein